LLALLVPRIQMAAAEPSPQVGLAVRDITPETPIRLAGYAGRKQAADRVEHPLLVQALALKNASGERFVFVALDNCEVSRAFMEPVLRQLADQFQLAPGTVAVVSSHTHSGPVLNDTLTTMNQGSGPENERIANYSRLLQGKLVEVVGAALADCQPASFEQGLGRATFAMNRRVYQGDKVVFGDTRMGRWIGMCRCCGSGGPMEPFGQSCSGMPATGRRFGRETIGMWSRANTWPMRAITWRRMNPARWRCF